MITNPYEEIESLSIAHNGCFNITKTNVNPNILEPKVRKIMVDNYDGTIMIVADYVNKIQWFCGDEIINTKYNIVGQFKTKFNVENLEYANLQFRLIGNSGETVSKSFGLEKHFNS